MSKPAKTVNFVKCIRKTEAQFSRLGATGSSIGATTDTYWFRYDSMNRLVTDRGQLSGAAGAAGTTIVRSASPASHDILYNAAGERVEVRSTHNKPAKEHTSPHGDPILIPARFWEVLEAYSYDAGGRLLQVRISNGSEVEDDGGPLVVPTAPAPTLLRSSFSYDALGRATAQVDYDTNGTTAIFSRNLSYNAKGQITVDDSSTLRWRANAVGVTDLLRSRAVYDYGAGAGYALGSAVSIATQTWNNGIDGGSNGAPDTLTTTVYAWYDGAVQASVTFDGDTGSGSNALGVTTYAYDARGLLASVGVNDGRARSATAPRPASLMPTSHSSDRRSRWADLSVIPPSSTSSSDIVAPLKPGKSGKVR